MRLTYQHLISLSVGIAALTLMAVALKHGNSAALGWGMIACGAAGLSWNMVHHA